MSGSPIALALSVVAAACIVFLQAAATAGGPIDAVQVMVAVSPDAAGLEKGMAGTHVMQMQAAARSKAGQDDMAVGCVPCFSVFLSFAFQNGRLYAINGQTDSRRDRYRAEVNGQSVPIEGMNGLRGRDWLDAFGGIDQVPGCARDLAKKKDLDAVLKLGVCVSGGDARRISKP